jgi:hypothetical protein
MKTLLDRVLRYTAAVHLPGLSSSRYLLRGASSAALVALGLFGFAAPALAADAPAWNLTAAAIPSNFTPNGTGPAVQSSGAGPEVDTRGNTIELVARNLGKAPIVGADKPIALSVDLHGGLAVGIAGGGMSCKQPAGPCVFSGAIEPGQALKVEVTVRAGAPGTVSGVATISGGEVNGQPLTPASVEDQIAVSDTPAPFGLDPGSVLAEFVNADGGPATQVGSHPYDLAVDFSLAIRTRLASSGLTFVLVQAVRDIAVELPAGVVGNELAVGQCESSVLEEARCPGVSQVGAIHPQIEGVGLATYAVFNMEPSNGRTNELGFNTKSSFSVQMPTAVRTGGDYGLTSITPHVPNTGNPLEVVEANIWGVPGDPSHDPQRVLAGYLANPNTGPGTTPREQEEAGGHTSPLPPAPFLTMPTRCDGKPLVFKIAVDSVAAPGRLLPDGEPDLSDSNWERYTVSQPAMTGCEDLQSFTPHLTVAPATTYSDTPTGTTVEVSVPQGEGLTNPNALATSTLQNTKVTLPAGMVVSPGQANGLGACQPSEDGVGTTGPPSCPGNSKVGTVEIETPLLPDKLEGNVYILQSNPPNLKLLVAASADDVNLKLVGDVHLDEATGQLTSTFSGTPQLPFTHFRLIFSGGAQAALTTPPSCGVYSSTSDFTPWSSPATPDFLSDNGFALTAGPGGSACQSPLPFAPSLIAGATTDQAGGFTDFSLLLQRNDGEQRIAALQFKTPAGLSGMISKIPLCQEPQAAAGTCSAASQIGHTVVGSGAGPAPLYIPEAGQPPAPIYLTGPYKGAPFGLSIVVPVIAGPFNLGTVVVRAAISVDPTTAQITVTTDPLPQILAGVPTNLRQINTVIDRPGFMFNPTSCAQKEFSGVAQSAQGTTAAISSRFQVGSCQSLAFKPNFKVTTQGKTSKAKGASLDAKIVYPTTTPGANQASGQSNIGYVKVDLPKQLPSRLTTLQQACAAAQFAANPAGCPAASVVGHAKVITPLLPVPVEGPAYFVSHGGEAFPSLTMVLQGDGVTVDLVGTTFIKKGVTSSTFKSVPDVPFSSFELYLPEGKYSALAANGNLCTSKLVMPTAFVGQNGAEIHQSTKIGVTGCPKAEAKKKTKAKKARKSSHAGHGRAGR